MNKIINFLVPALPVAWILGYVKATLDHCGLFQLSDYLYIATYVSWLMGIFALMRVMYLCKIDGWRTMMCILMLIAVSTTSYFLYSFIILGAQ